MSAPPPVVSPLAEQLYAALWPITGGDEDRAWALLLLVALVAHPLDEIDSLVADTDDGPGWSILFDVDRTPAKWLPFTGALVGVQLTPGATEDASRAQIRDHPAFQRGTPDALIAAVKTTLTGTDPLVRLIERDGSPYRVTVLTRTAETPDLAAAQAAADNAVPYWIWPTVAVSDEPIIDEGTLTIDTAADVAIDSVVIGDV